MVRDRPETRLTYTTLHHPLLHAPHDHARPVALRQQLHVHVGLVDAQRRAERQARVLVLARGARELMHVDLDLRVVRDLKPHVRVQALQHVARLDRAVPVDRRHDVAVLVTAVAAVLRPELEVALPEERALRARLLPRRKSRQRRKRRPEPPLHNQVAPYRVAHARVRVHTGSMRGLMSPPAAA